MTATITEPDATFGGLLRSGETPQGAIARLDATLAAREFTAAIESDEGQRLMSAAAAASSKARRAAVADAIARERAKPELEVAPKAADPRYGATSHHSERMLFDGYGVKL